MRGIWLTHRVKPERLQEFVEAYRNFAQASTEMPGCLRYDVMQDEEEPTLVYANAVYSDDEGQAFHFNSEAAQAWRAMSLEWRVPVTPDAEPGSIRHRLSYIYPPPDAWR